jgi:hypothetical protein
MTKYLNSLKRRQPNLLLPEGDENEKAQNSDQHHRYTIIGPVLVDPTAKIGPISPSLSFSLLPPQCHSFHFV